jgi:hypothetical protein
MQINDARAAIWSDIESNAWVGNGNEAVSLDWWMGHDRAHPPETKISELYCSSDGERGRCWFTLERVPPSGASASDQAEARRLTCEAKLVLSREEVGSQWKVEHLPPAHGRGHSRTTMECRALKVG